MKILLLDNSLDNTGASKALIKTVSEIPGKEFEFIFLFPKGSHCLRAAEDQGFAAIPMKFLEISKRPGGLALYLPRLFSNAYRIRKLVQREGIDIIHVNDIYNMLGLATKMISGVKVITHIRRMPESFPGIIYKTWSRLHLKYADHIIAVSEANRRALPSNDKTTVMYDPLPEQERLPVYHPRPLLEKKVRILYLANYTGGKGHQHALEVLKRAKANYPGWDFSLHFYGGNFGMQKNSDYRQSLADFSKANGLDGIVQFNNKTAEVESTMKSYDLVLNLSDSESFSRVTLEALFYGVPIIATDVGGTNEMVIDGETGLLAAPFNIDSMYDAFRKMIADDDLRLKMAAAGYDYVRQAFSAERTVSKLISIYKAVKTGSKP
ncbi:MAG TPA: glycosyltransferase [Flavisolibacter sp.]|nr:glycosyltransferase [Flavisolibacter sp.]